MKAGNRTVQTAISRRLPSALAGRRNVLRPNVTEAGKKFGGIASVMAHRTPYPIGSRVSWERLNRLAWFKPLVAGPCNEDEAMTYRHTLSAMPREKVGE